MTITLTKHDPQPLLLEGGSGYKPPALPGASIANPDRPEMENLDPSQHQLRAETDAEFHNMTKQLGSLTAKSDQLIASHDAAKLSSK